MVLGLALACTGATAYFTQREVRAAALRRFEHLTEEVQARVEDRLKDHEQVLRDAAGLFDAAGEVTRGQWQAWVSRSQVHARLPGLEVLSFAPRVAGPDLARHQAEAARQGFPGYRVWPAGPRPEYAPVSYLEPLAGDNLRAFGYDLLSEEGRRIALEAARDCGCTVLTRALVLVQDLGRGEPAGALMVVPVYRPGLPAATVEARRAALRGWITGAYRMEALMHGALGAQALLPGAVPRLQVRDADRDGGRLLYDSRPGGAEPVGASLDRLLPVAGRGWTLRFTSPEVGSPLPAALVLLGGALLSALLFALTRARLAADERKRAQAALAESEHRFRTLADTAPVLIWSSGLDARCDWFNLPWLDFTGRRLEEELGDGWAEGVHPEDLPGCLETYRSSFEARRPFRMEYRLRRHDGAWRWVLDHGIPRRGDDGAFQGYLGSCIDVTEMREARLALQRSLDELRKVEAAVEQAPTSIVITDLEGGIEYVNPAFERTTGYSRAEALGRNSRFLKSGVHDQAFYRELWDTIRAGRVWQGKLVNRTKAGANVTEQAVIAPVLDAAGAVRSYVAVKRDIGAELALERQLRQAQRLESIGRLAGGVAHDFNNLLTVILGCSGSLLQELSEGRPADREALQEIRAAGERATHLTRQLLAFARRQVIAPVPLDLNAVLDGCEKLLRRTLGEAVELVVSRGPGLWPTRCDPGQLEQVIVNLAINARDAMEGAGRLTIETANLAGGPLQAALFPDLAAGDYVRLAVQDTGSGIPAADRERIFEPFFTTKEVGRGTGLGLATVYGIVKQSGGHIRVESQVGYGTLFEILLPRTEAPLAGREARGQAPPRGGSETVLLLEDDAAVRQVVAHTLRGQGYRVLVAADAAEALAAAEGEAAPPSLLITDVVLPGVDGRAAAAQLQQRHGAVPTLYISGYPREVLGARQALDPGVEFLPKPFTEADLLRRVRDVLDARAG